MATGGRLLNQVMPETYRQGFTYTTKIPKAWRGEFKPRPQTKMKRYGEKILRRALKNNLNKQLNDSE